MAFRMSKSLLLAVPVLAQVFKKRKFVLPFLGAFSGGEIFGIIVGCAIGSVILYVGYTKRYELEYAVSTYLPSTGNSYGGTSTPPTEAVNIPTTMDANDVVSVAVNESTIDSGIANPTFEDVPLGMV